MTIGIEITLNELETRLNSLEQRTMKPTQQRPQVYLDDETGTSMLEDPLDWAAAAGGWESYTTISPLVADEAAPGYPGGELSTDYPMPEASLIGSMCMLTGLVRRKGVNLAAGARHNSVMFGLPGDWRPMGNVLIPCLMGSGDPATLATVATAWVEVRPELAPTLRPSGRAYFVAGTTACNTTTGWIALHGIFPCQVVPSGG